MEGRDSCESARETLRNQAQSIPSNGMLFLCREEKFPEHSETGNREIMKLFVSSPTRTRKICAANLWRACRHWPRPRPHHQRQPRQTRRTKRRLRLEPGIGLNLLGNCWSEATSLSERLGTLCFESA